MAGLKQLKILTSAQAQTDDEPLPVPAETAATAAEVPVAAKSGLASLRATAPEASAGDEAPVVPESAGAPDAEASSASSPASGFDAGLAEIAARVKPLDPTAEAEAFGAAPAGAESTEAASEAAAGVETADGDTASPAEHDGEAGAAEPAPMSDEDKSLLERYRNGEDLSEEDLIRALELEQADRRQQIRALEDRKEELGNAPRQGGYPGSALGTIISLLFSRDHAAAELRKIDRNQARLREELEALPPKFRDRIFAVKFRQLSESLEALQAEGDKLAAGVREFNGAFESSEPGKKFMASVDDYATSLGLTRSQAIQVVREGKSSDPRVAAAAAQFGLAMKDPAVSGPFAKAQASLGEIERLASRATDDMGLLAKNFGDRFDVQAAKRTMESTFAAIQASTPAPVAEALDGEDKKKLAERLKEIAESVSQAMERLVAAVVAAFSMAKHG
jgi:hypothetical protein